MRKRNWQLITLITTILISSCFVPPVLCSSTSSSNVDWAMFRQDPSHNGYIADNGSANSAKLLWNYTTGRMVQSSPAVAYGYVFVGSRDSEVYCLNASNGKLYWAYAIRSEVWSSPAIFNASVYVGADDGYVYCFDIMTGQPLWRTNIGGEVRSSPAIVNGVVFIGSGKQDVYALNATDGSIMWVFPTLSRVNSSPAVSSGVVYISTGDDYVYAINASRGSQIWSHQIRTTVSSPAVQDDFLYVGSYDGYVYGLNATTGAQIWRYQTADEVDSSPAVAYGCVYVGSQDNSVYCLNASTGGKIWQSSTGFWVTSSPAISDGNVFVSSRDNDIYCFNATTGAREWSYQTGNNIESSPAVVNDILYVGSDDSNIYALALYNSTTQTQLSQPVNSIPITTIIFDAITLAIGALTIFTVVRYFYNTRKLKQIAEPIDKSNEKYSWFKSHADAIFVLIILAFSVIFFVNLGKGVLQAADEQTYTQWAYHMFRTGDYFTPWTDGAINFMLSKPPLLMWLMSFAYQVFGVTNFASRIWSAVFGALSLVVVLYLGRKLYNRYVGFLAAIVLGTFVTYYTFARYAMTDVPLTCFVVASIYFFVISEEKEKPNRYTALSGLFFGLALMTKQIDALLIPLIVFTYLLTTKRSIRFLFKKHFTLLWAVGFLVFLPWLISMAVSFGSPFWQGYFIYSDVARTTGVLEGHSANYLFYFNYLAHNENWVWLALLPFGVGLCAFNAFVKGLKSDTLIFLWVAIVLIVFSFAQTKIYWYIMPVFPAFAIAIASLVYELAKKVSQFTRHLNRKNR